jgi:hypothetical protein
VQSLYPGFGVLLAMAFMPDREIRISVLPVDAEIATAWLSHSNSGLDYTYAIAPGS